MLPLQRQKKIKDYLVENGFASIDELGKVFSVSGMTIRRDLDELQRRGLIQRTYGGAMDTEKAFFEMSFHAKAGQFAEEKERIGKAAAELVQDGDTVFIDSGTTTYQVARFIKEKKITVVTNSLNIALELVTSPTVDIQVTGGILRKGPLNVYGPQTEIFLNQIRVDKVFIGIEGVDLDSGISVPDPFNAQNKQSMIKISKLTYVVADHSKLGRNTANPIAPLEEVDLIISGKEADPKILKQLSKKVKVKLV